jgi:phosphopantothenoylcysteine decarboxylase
MTRVVYVIGCAAPPVLRLTQLCALLQQHDWQTHTVLTPTAAEWVDHAELARASGNPVRVGTRQPGEDDPLPIADAVLAAPLTFNTINKWAAGTNDNLALGLLNELLGAGVPIVAAPCVKAALRSHPAYATNLKLLTDAGLTILNGEDLIFRTDDGLAMFTWPAVVEALNNVKSKIRDNECRSR